MCVNQGVTTTGCALTEWPDCVTLEMCWHSQSDNQWNFVYSMYCVAKQKVSQLFSSVGSQFTRFMLINGICTDRNVKQWRSKALEGPWFNSKLGALSYEARSPKDWGRGWSFGERSPRNFLAGPYHNLILTETSCHLSSAGWQGRGLEPRGCIMHGRLIDLHCYIHFFFCYRLEHPSIVVILTAATSY